MGGYGGKRGGGGVSSAISIARSSRFAWNEPYPQWEYAQHLLTRVEIDGQDKRDDVWSLKFISLRWGASSPAHSDLQYGRRIQEHQAGLAQ
jgi:hypothetical protein